MFDENFIVGKLRLKMKANSIEGHKRESMGITKEGLKVDELSKETFNGAYEDGKARVESRRKKTNRWCT